MKHKIEAPNVPDSLTDMTAELTALRTKDELRLGAVSDTVIEGQEARKVSFEKMVFTNVTVTDCTFVGIELTDVIFEKCDLSNVCLTDSFFHRTEFRNCKLIGTDFARSKFRNVRFTGCVGDYAAFRLSDFKHTVFEGNSLVGADYYHCSLHKSAFADCQIDQAIMSGTRLEGIDLSDCEFDGLTVEIEDLKGCAVSARQASSFAGLLGLIIK